MQAHSTAWPLLCVQMELPATAAALERVGAGGVWVPPTDAIRQLLVLVKQGEPARSLCGCLR